MTSPITFQPQPYIFTEPPIVPFRCSNCGADRDATIVLLSNGELGYMLDRCCESPRFVQMES
jgi:hypothetical protein